MGDEITITLTDADMTEAMSVSSSSTTLSDVVEFASVLFFRGKSSNHISLTHNGKTLDTTNSNSDSLQAVGIRDGDLILVELKSGRRAVVAKQTEETNKLDFSNLLPSTNRTTAKKKESSLMFDISNLSSSNNSNNVPIEWAGMSLDDAISHNPNPDTLIPLLLNFEAHPNLWKELNYHSPALAKSIRSGGLTNGPRIWRQEIMKGALHRTLSTNQTQSLDAQMSRRLSVNPMDQEAKQYLEEKARKQEINEQYQNMMNEYPESMGRVLMLYIPAEVNGHEIQAFVDSGAQNTIMSQTCAQRCNLLIDDRFQGMAVGVGTGKIIGRVHVVHLQIQGHYFPCSITVMEKDMNDMDCLFGLDMLKRHGCKIDLEKNSLIFKIGDQYMEQPFLHEKDLALTKGGTKGFDADQSNAEFEQSIQETQHSKMLLDEEDEDESITKTKRSKK